MNISNNTDVSDLIASSVSKLNLNSVKKPNLDFAKKTAGNTLTHEEEIISETEILPEDKPKISVDVDDIKKYAGMIGENVSVDDINYGIMYGRSVIADYIA